MTGHRKLQEAVPGYAKKVRAVPAWLKRQAYAEYGITEYRTGDYEVDHLIPLSLGGSNSIRNLWPQSTKTSPWNSSQEHECSSFLTDGALAEWGAYVKDALPEETPQARMRRPIASQDRPTRDSLRLDRSVQEIRSLFAPPTIVTQRLTTNHTTEKSFLRNSLHNKNLETTLN